MRRVHTVAFPVVQEVNELFRATDAAATAALLAKLAVEKSYSSKLDETRAAIQARCVIRDNGCHRLQERHSNSSLSHTSADVRQFGAPMCWVSMRRQRLLILSMA